MKRAVLWGAVIVAAVVVAVGGLFYYRHEQRYPSTNNAYVKANVVNVAAEVSGRVEAVPVSDQMAVDAGQLLFRIDPRRYRDRVQAAKARLQLARQTVRAERAAVHAAEAAVASQRTELANARKHFDRIKRLAERGARSQSSLDDARARLDVARADLRLAKAKRRKARMQLGNAGDGNGRVEKARAALDQARLDLRHTRIEASCAGRVSNVKLNAGDMVSAGESQFALVCDQRFWVYANFKETALQRLRPGQVATITLDLYPQHTFHGIVQSMNPASGTAFSLLPPENATGNWVKVAQRVPVRIVIVDGDPRYPLRVQTSAKVVVDTGAGSPPLGRSRGDKLSGAEAMRLAEQKGLIDQSGSDAQE